MYTTQKARNQLHMQHTTAPQMSAQPSFEAVPANAEPAVFRGPDSSFMRIGDPTDALPESAKARIFRLRDELNDLQSLARSAMENVEEIRLTKLGYVARLNQLTRPRANGGHNLGADDPLVTAEEKKIAKASADFARLDAIADERHNKRGEVQQLLGHIEAWLLHGLPGGTRIEPLSSPPAILKKGADVLTEVKAKRHELLRLRAELSKTRTAPYPSAVAKRIVREQVEAMAAAGKPDVTGTLGEKAPAHFPTAQVMARVFNSEPAAVTFPLIPDANGLVAWLLKDQLKAAMDRLIAEHADDANALSDDDRATREAKLLADILAVERAEVGLVYLANASGIPCAFRPDTAPLALLDLGLVTGAAPVVVNEGNWITELLGAR